MDCIIKVVIARGNFLCIKGLHIQKIQKHMRTSASLCEGPMFYFSVFTFMQESISSHSHFNLNYSLVCKRYVVGKNPGTYGHSNIFDHELLLLTIISMINKLGGETLRPYLSLYSMDTICSKKYMLWVLAIIEDYMMVEYVDLLLILCWE